MSSRERKGLGRFDRGLSAFSAGVFLLGGLAVIWITEMQRVRQLAANLMMTYLWIWAVALLFSRTSPRELHVRFALTTLTIGFAGVALEALAFTPLIDYRAVFGTHPPEPWLNPDNRFDEELFYLRQPFLEISGTSQGNAAAGWCLPAAFTHTYPYDARYDQHGFRNARDLSAASIAVVGDSYIEAVKVSSEETLTGQLAALSEGPVANLGQSGYGPQQELAVLRRFALPLNPDVIVWAFYEGNDLHDIGNYERRKSLLSSGVLRTEFTPRDRSFSQNALLALYRLIDSCEPAPEAELLYGVFDTADNRRVRMYFVDLLEKLVEPRISEPLEELGEILAQANALATQRGARLLLLYLPIKQRVYGDLVESPTYSRLRSPSDSELPALLEALVRERSPEIAFLDLTAVLRSEAAKGRLLYFTDDTHLTPEGHRLAAETIWKFLSDPEQASYQALRPTRSPDVDASTSMPVSPSICSGCARLAG